jgi:DNA-binding CsgD family transcriptional regulator
MAWLEDVDLGVVRSLRAALGQARSALELVEATLSGLDEAVPADSISWNELDARGAVRWRVGRPPGAEAPGAFDAFVRSASDHPLLHAQRGGGHGATRLSEAAGHELARSEIFGELLRPSGSAFGIAVGIAGHGEERVVVALGRREREFSERERDLLDLATPVIAADLDQARARERLLRAVAAEPPPGTAVLLLNRYGEIEHSDVRAERWLAEHFGAAEHPGWLPGPVAAWLALPPRPPLISRRGERCLEIHLIPGDPHALLLEERVESFREDALHELGLSAREREVLQAARRLGEEQEIAEQLFLSSQAVRRRLEQLEQKLGVDSPAGAIAAALRASL